MRKVFLDDLPKKLGRGINKNKECIDWSNSIGFKVKFIYDDIEGELEIVKFNKEKYKLNVKYNNDIFLISTTEFINCKLGEIVGKFIINYRYNIGDIIETKTGEIKILEQIRINNKNNHSVKAYKYKCLIDGNIDQLIESNMINGVGCNVCTGTKVLKGYNDLWTTHPHIAKHLKYSEIGHEISHGSNKSEIFICLDCGYEKEYRINDLTNYNYFCFKCKDNNSYPNKFAFNLLEQLNINFTPEYNPDWIKPQRYDFYFKVNNKEYILEMDGGLGHGNKNTLNGQTEEDRKLTKEIDNYKDMMAQEHNIEVIRINSVKSELEFIKNNILHSELNILFDLYNIDWLKCHEFSLTNLVKIACNHWNDGIKSAKIISEIMKMSKNTIIKYLKQGTELGWCNYNVKQVLINNGKINGKKVGIPIIQLSPNGKYITEFESATEASRQLNLLNNNISACCRGKRKTAGGYRWMYKIDYDKYMNDIDKSIQFL